MTSMYDEPSPSMLAAIASEIVERHRHTAGQRGPAAGCESCTPAGCPHLAWADRALAEHRADRAARLAPPR